MCDTEGYCYLLLRRQQVMGGVVDVWLAVLYSGWFSSWRMPVQQRHGMHCLLQSMCHGCTASVRVQQSVPLQPNAVQRLWSKGVEGATKGAKAIVAGRKDL